MYLQLADNMNDTALFDNFYRQKSDKYIPLESGGRGRAKLRSFVNSKAFQTALKIGKGAANLGISAIPGGSAAPQIAVKLTGAYKLAQKHGSGTRKFIQGLFAAKTGKAATGAIPIAVSKNASPAEIAAAKEAANLINSDANQSPDMPISTTKTTGSGLFSNPLAIGGAALLALYLLKK
jgi:hypothetical protein